MFKKRKKKTFLSRVYSFAITWVILSVIFPLYRLSGLLPAIGISTLVAYLVGKSAGRSEKADEKRETEKRGRAGREKADYNPAAGTKRASERTGNAPAAEKRAEEQRAAEERLRNAARENRRESSGSECDRTGSAGAEPVKAAPKKKSYGPEIDPIVEEGNRAMSEMGRLYMSIQDPEIRLKINEIMRITDKITQDAIEDPTDIPQIKKFFRYYLPTTIKLLNSYDRMASQGIEGENINKSMKNISEMLDVAIAAYKKRLDSLFENQALDIETDIDVMNQMLAREGLTGDRDFAKFDHADKQKTKMTGTAVQTAAAGQTKG